MNRRGFFKASMITAGSMALFGSALARGAIEGTNYGASSGLAHDLTRLAP